MHKHQSDLSSADPPVHSVRRQQLVDVWIELNMSGDAGATTWEVLDRFSNAVTECLLAEPPLLNKAESLTAEAFLLRNGMTEC
jgi:hypothetical protein